MWFVKPKSKFLVTLRLTDFNVEHRNITIDVVARGYDKAALKALDKIIRDPETRELHTKNYPFIEAMVIRVEYGETY